MSELDDLREVLLRGQRLSGQGSYARRKPAETAVPYLLEAREGFHKFVHDHQGDAEAWRLLSLAEEFLLHYGAAMRCLERAIELSERRDRKDLKRLALLREQVKQWRELGLTPTELAELGQFLDNRLAEQGCDCSLRLTNDWLAAAGIHSPESVLEGIRERGAYCDCEVLANVV